MNLFLFLFIFFFFKQKTAYVITTGDWSSDVCSSDLEHVARQGHRGGRLAGARGAREEEVREVRLLRIRLEPLDDLVLADDLVEGLRAILLDPDFLHLRPRVRVSSGGRVISLWRRGSEVARIVASKGRGRRANPFGGATVRVAR